MVSITHVLRSIRTDSTPEAWILRKNSANCQLPYCNNSCKPECEWRVKSAYNITSGVDNIYSCLEEKERRDFCFEHGTLLFRTWRVVFFRCTPFCLFVPCFRSPPSQPSSCFSLLTRSSVLWSFSLGRINGHGPLQRPLQSNTVYSVRVESKRTIHKERGIRGNA